VQEVCNKKAGDNYPDGKQVQFQPLAPETAEKPRTNINTDGINKKYQAEIADKGQHMQVSPHSEMCQQESGKQHAGNPKPEVLHIYSAKENPGKGSDAQVKNRSSDPRSGKQASKCLHRNSSH